MELRCLTDDAALVRAVQKLNLGILPVQPPVFCYRRAAKDTHCLSWAAMISDGGAVCGAVIADLELERSGHRTVQLRTLAVPTQFRRQGIGKKLVLKVIQQAKKAEEDTGEIDAVRLHVHTENDGALAFYKALGFVEKDRVEDYYRHLEPRTAFVMEYSLH